MGMTSTERSRARRARMTSGQRTAETTYNARRRREALVLLLAPDLRCAECGEAFRVDQLEIDHVAGIGWRHVKLSSHARVAAYWREYRAGVPMRALCRSDSARTGQRFRGRKVLA